MTEFSVLTNTLTMLVEWVSILFFFRRLENRSEGGNRWLGFACLLLLFFIYIPVIQGLNATTSFSADNLFNQILRTGINFLAVYGYLRFTKEKSRALCGYLAALFVLIYMVSFNLRQAFHPFLLGLGPKRLERVMLFMLAVFQWSTVYVAYRLLDMQNIRDALPSRYAVVIISILVELYFKWSLIAPADGSVQRPVDTVFYSLCATLGIFALVILLERNITYQQNRSAMQMEQLQLRYETQNAKRALRANTDLRRLYHDMKNHLLALQTMMDGGEQTNEYLSELCSRLEEYEVNVHTGNSVADALLAEKMERARLDGIRFNVCADLTPLRFVHSVDMVTILGNATDNAVEALQMLPDGQERIVYIKTARYANMVVLRISNQFTGKLVIKNGLLHTGKQDPAMHGIGLSSIEKAVKRYGGNVETQFENEGGWFRLIIMLPVPETDEYGENNKERSRNDHER